MASNSGARPHNIRADDYPDRGKDCLLFYCPEAEPLARDIAQASARVELGEVQWNRFEDGFPNLFVKNALTIRNRHVGFLASFHSTEAIFEQISLIYALPRLFVSSFTLVLPFFPTGTHERIESEGEVATAFTLARILSNIPLSRGGPTSLVTYDIHALQERFYFGDAVLPLFESGIPLLLNALTELPDVDDVTIAYPDDGSWKRFHTFLHNFPEVICTKIRVDGKKIVKLKEGEVSGRHIVMVDDLVQTGGTLIECHSVLAAHGAKHSKTIDDSLHDQLLAVHISAYVTHGVFPDHSYKRFKPENNSRSLTAAVSCVTECLWVDDASTGFANFWMTDSCVMTVRCVRDRSPFRILSLSDAIAQTLQI